MLAVCISCIFSRNIIDKKKNKKNILRKYVRAHVQSQISLYAYRGHAASHARILTTSRPLGGGSGDII